MKRFVFALVLTCAFSLTTMAGEIPSTGITATSPPPPPPTLLCPTPTSDYELASTLETNLIEALLSILGAAL